MDRKRTVVALFFAVVVLGMYISINSCVHQPTIRPTTAIGDTTVTVGICFERDILPIFQSNCAQGGCHDAVTHEDGYLLDSYANIIKKGIKPGDPGESKIYEVLVEDDSDDRMPRGAQPLSTANIGMIKKWIEQGAVDSGSFYSSCDSTKFTYSGAIAPMLQTHCTGCHSATSISSIDLTDYNGVRTVALNGKLFGAVSHTTGYSAMPKSGAKLLDCQITQVRRWVSAGAPNN